jgi:protein SCO1/2
LAATVVGLALFWQPELETQPTAPSGGDFILHSADGPVDTRSFRGKVLLIYFGYTYCPDICTTALAITGQALRQLSPEESAQVQTVFVSVDPQRDTPDRLKPYTAFFHPSIIGVTGSDEEIARAARQYGASYVRHDTGSDAGYVVDHSAWMYVVAPDGHLVGRMAHGTPADQMVAEIRKWLPHP